MAREEEVRGEIRFRPKREAASRKSTRLRLVFTEMQRLKALVMLRDGETIRQVAKRFGVTQVEVRALKRSGR